MTVASEITRIKNNIANAYTSASGKGATLPEVQNSENLASCIDSITGGGSGGASDETTAMLKAVIDGGDRLIPTIVIPEGTTTIRQNAFSYVYVDEIIMPNSVTTIKQSAFDGCGVRTLNLSTALTSIGIFAFNGANQMNGSITVPSGVTNIPMYCFNQCNSLDIIYVEGDVTSIGGSAFASSSLAEIHFKASIQSTIEAMSDYTSKWGATKATIYFDL